jgi:signal transduction histidine kinase/CheY-like chemotaxis protein
MSIDASLAAWVVGSGEMAARIRAYPWSRTRLGPLESWSQTLRTYVRIMLTSRQAMWIGWGEELIGLYNDAYCELLGVKHGPLGRPAAATWSQIWDRVRPSVQKTLYSGQGTYEEAMPLLLDRRGFLEEAAYTISNSPIVGEQGRAVGVLSSVTDETARVIAERQLALLHEVSSQGAGAGSVEEACRRCARAIAGADSDLPFALLYVTDDQRRSASLLGAAGLDVGHAAAPATIDLKRPSIWPFAESLRTAETQTVDDLAAIVGPLPARPGRNPPTQAVVVPLLPSPGAGPAAILVAGLNPHRSFDSGYRMLIALLARQIAPHLSRTLDQQRERGRAQAADHARRRLFGFLEQSPIAVVIMHGPELCVEFANREFERINGRHDVVGKSMREVFSDIPADAPLWSIFERVYATGTPFVTSEHRLERDLGNGRETTYWTYNLHPLRDEEGRVEALMVSSVNVTDIVRARKAVEAARVEAEKANRGKDEFMAMLGHELRNPLTTILATLAALRMDGSKLLVQERRIIERQARQLADTVDDLLDVSRIVAGKVALTRRPVELADIVSKSVEASTPLLDERAHEMHIDVPHGLVVDGDQRRLVQVVTNLIGNAAKYTGVAGRIEVTAERQDGLAILCVRDNGIGIAREILPRIFDRFRQSDRTLDRAQGGLGLGLSIVRNIVQLHGGVVTAHSDGPNRGSEFTVRLPCEPARRMPRGRMVRSNPPRTTTVSRTILIVDDNRDIAEVLARVLRARGHAVRVAHDGPAALESVHHFRPDFALLDIGLPLMDGYQLARRLRKQQGMDKLSLLAISGYGQASDVERARRAGFAAHITKPIDVERLVAMLERR